MCGFIELETMKAHTLKKWKKGRKEGKKMLTGREGFGIIYKRQPRGRRSENQIEKNYEKDEKKLWQREEDLIL